MEKLLEERVVLRGTSRDGKPLEAHFAVSKGMNLLSFKKGAVEAIDQSTWPLFEERAAGLGALIGPHFHHRKQIPPVLNESLFPHIAGLKAKGVNEPFSHGIGRYAPWTVEAFSEKSVQTVLKGKDEWKGVKLEALEGQDFIMRYAAELKAEGLIIHLSCISDRSSVIGLHTYYALQRAQGKVIAQVQDHYSDGGELKQIPSSWNYNHDHTLVFDLSQESDFGFFPFPNPLQGSVFLETTSHQMKVEYAGENEENSWQLWHPKGASFVCIEPLSAKNPRSPCLSESHLKILISIL